MLHPDFDSESTTVRIYRRGHVSKCKTSRCGERATLIAEKVDGAGRHVRQIELCPQHCEMVIERERARGLEICDGRREHLCVTNRGIECRRAHDRNFRAPTPAVD